MFSLLAKHILAVAVVAVPLIAVIGPAVVVLGVWEGMREGGKWLFIFLGILVGYLILTPLNREKFENWLNDNNLTLLEKRQCGLFDAPFSLQNLYGDVYWIVVEDRSGRVRRGWLNLGARLASPISISWSS